MPENQIYELEMIVTLQISFAPRSQALQGRLPAGQTILALKEISRNVVIWSNRERSYRIELEC